MKKGKAALLVLLFVVVMLLGCEGSGGGSVQGSAGSSTFTWADVTSSGLQSLGYSSAAVSGAACTPAPINGGDGVNFDTCLVAFTDGRQIHVSRPGGQWAAW